MDYLQPKVMSFGRFAVCIVIGNQIELFFTSEYPIIQEDSVAT
jgi:hypothetical protein